MRRFRRRAGAATVAVTVLGLVLSSTVAQANDPQAAPAPAQASADEQVLDSVSPEMIRAAAGGQGSVPLTLITGDTVHVGIDEDGNPVVQDTEAAPRADRRTVVFHTITRGERTYVVPGDALSLISADVLDWELFNVAELAKHAARGTVGEVPVIISHEGGFSTMQAPAQVEGVEVERTFDTIDATAGAIDGDGGWWRQVSETAPAGGPAAMSAASPLAGVEKVWLEPLLEVQLDDSVPQVGAPVAWDAGDDGSGVTVAVLDTGIDADHPDVAGKIVEAVDFTDSALGVADGYGHGTHVAATIAGTGDAAAGQRPGVAPGADLRIGKVCTADGGCPGAAILDGMEWAAQSGAPVVNMSLGSSPTDGTDPLSQMVNQLSAAHGTLFAISAGNSGPNNYTVGAPGAADAALAVAAVDKAGEMAEFSSRGPRVGDDVLKPDIAAPGVGIVAARAEGTAMGTPVDAHYTAANGTSMAAPHVAGGAAIVAQQNPDLTGSELKALLMSTALDLGHHIHAQGAGRMDLARATDPSVFTGGNVDFGRLEYPHQEPVNDILTFINVTDQPVTLSLSGDLTAGEGSPAPEGLFTLGDGEVTVPAEGSIEVDATVDGTAIGDEDVFGPYSGLVEAHDNDGELRAVSRVQVFLEPERFEVTVETTMPDDARDVSYDPTIVTPMDDQVHLHDDPLLLPRETATAELFAGAYDVRTAMSWRDESGESHEALPIAPEVTVNGDTTVELDLNQAEPLHVDVGEPSETDSANLTIDRVSDTGAWEVSSSLDEIYRPYDPNWWVLPTEEEVQQGSLRVASGHVLVPQQVEFRAIGGGPPVTLDGRYASTDVSVRGQYLEWVEDGVVEERRTRLPVPRLDSDRRPVDLAHAGAGTAEDIAGADLDGRLALITPTDICALYCDFPQLRERVAAAAAAGAVGVLVAGDSGTVGVSAPTADTIRCDSGRDSCPAVEPYAPVPVVGVPAKEAGELIDRLQRRPVVKVQIGGDGAPSRIYALSFTTEGRVPGDLPYRVDADDLVKVQHRIHDDAPSETGAFTWARVEPDVPPSVEVELPRVASQQSVTTFVSPSDGEAIDRFRLRTVDFEEPFVETPPDLPEPGEGDRVVVRIGVGEIQELAPAESETISWNTGPTVPAAVQPVTTEQGFTFNYGMCAGCREGNTLWPTMYAASSTGQMTNEMTGLLNDTGVGMAFDGAHGCDPPRCEISLYDGDGDELEPTITPVEDLVVGPGGEGAGGELPRSLADAMPGELSDVFGVGASDEEANR